MAPSWISGPVLEPVVFAEGVARGVIPGVVWSLFVEHRDLVELRRIALPIRPAGCRLPRLERLTPETTARGGLASLTRTIATYP
jgi:hypothetical protein